MHRSIRNIRESARESKKNDGMRSSYYVTQPNEDAGTLGTWGTVLAIMSTIVGGGMVSIPWAFKQSGFFIGIAVSLMASA